MTEPLPPTPVLQTERLTLRPYAAADVPVIQRIFPQWELIRWLHAGIPWPYPADGAATNMAQCLERRARDERFFWAITLKGDDTLIGRIDLWPFDGETRDMRGFWLDPAHQGRGLMTEAADAVTDYAFEVLDWPFLYLTNATANRASARVKEKQGAELVAVEAREYVGGPGEGQIWRLDRETWRARRSQA